MKKKYKRLTGSNYLDITKKMEEYPLDSMEDLLILLSPDKKRNCWVAIISWHETPKSSYGKESNA
jgi:hypothetical protein